MLHFLQPFVIGWVQARRLLTYQKTSVWSFSDTKIEPEQQFQPFRLRFSMWFFLIQRHFTSKAPQKTKTNFRPIDKSSLLFALNILNIIKGVQTGAIANQRFPKSLATTSVFDEFPFRINHICVFVYIPRVFHGKIKQISCGRPGNVFFIVLSYLPKFLYCILCGELFKHCSEFIFFFFRKINPTVCYCQRQLYFSSVKLSLIIRMLYKKFFYFNKNVI